MQSLSLVRLNRKLERLAPGRVGVSWWVSRVSVFILHFLWTAKSVATSTYGVQHYHHPCDVLVLVTAPNASSTTSESVSVDSMRALSQQEYEFEAAADYCNRSVAWSLFLSLGALFAGKAPARSTSFHNLALCFRRCKAGNVLVRVCACKWMCPSASSASLSIPFFVGRWGRQCVSVTALASSPAACTNHCKLLTTQLMLHLNQHCSATSSSVLTIVTVCQRGHWRYIRSGKTTLRKTTTPANNDTISNFSPSLTVSAYFLYSLPCSHFYYHHVYQIHFHLAHRHVKVMITM